MTHVWILRNSGGELYVFKTKKLALQKVKGLELKKRYGFYVSKCDDKYEITEYDFTLEKREVAK